MTGQAGREETDLSAATRRLLAAAAKVQPPAGAQAREMAESQGFQAFTEAYRHWIMFQRGTPGSPEERSEKARLLMYAMVGAATLGEAVGLLARFSRIVWGERGGLEVRDVGADVALTFDELFRPGVPGLISDLWPLSMLLSEFEFLVGGPLDGVSGQVRQASCLPPAAAALLFDRQLTYAAATQALHIPRRHLERAVVVRADQVEAFCARILPNTLRGAQPAADMSSLVAGLLRQDKLRQSDTPASLISIAARLGCSAATVRRRLANEGLGFREIKDGVFDELAKTWLTQDDLPIDEIAERLGYSDVFAFRRAFRRRNACSPTAYRRRLADGAVGDLGVAARP